MKITCKKKFEKNDWEYTLNEEIFGFLKAIAKGSIKKDEAIKKIPKKAEKYSIFTGSPDGMILAMEEDVANWESTPSEADVKEFYTYFYALQENFNIGYSCNEWWESLTKTTVALGESFPQFRFLCLGYLAFKQNQMQDQKNLLELLKGRRAI